MTPALWLAVRGLHCIFPGFTTQWCHVCCVIMQRVLGALRSARQYSSSATIALHGVHHLPTEPAGYVELRQYTLHPDGMKAYLKLTGDHVESRKQRTPFLGCCSPRPPRSTRNCLGLQ